MNVIKTPAVLMHAMGHRDAFAFARRIVSRVRAMDVSGGPGGVSAWKVAVTHMRHQAELISSCALVAVLWSCGVHGKPRMHTRSTTFDLG